MAKKASYNDIISVNEDWSMDEREGLPYSGYSVQKFIKQEGIIKAQTAYNQRYGASFFDSENNTILFFNDEEAKLEWLATNNESKIIGKLPLDFTGTINQIKINNLMGSTNIYFTTKQEENKIILGFTSQEKGLTDTYWNEVLEDAYFTISVDKLSTGNYITIIDRQLVVNGSTLTFDVKEYLATGTNKVKINVQGADTKASSVLILNATLTTMYLSPANFSWYLPFIEGTEYNLGGVNIGGAIDKTLKIIISNENGYHEEYDEPLGTDTYTTNAYFYKGLKFPTSGTGVYTVEMFLDAGNIRSDVLKYNIICVEEKDRTTAKIVAISNVLKEVINYQDNTYFSFVTYNGGASFSHPTITIKSNINNIITEISKDTLYNTATSSVIEFTRALEIESEEPNIQLTVDIDWGNTQSNTYAVDNTASYPPVGNYLFYLQPSTRSNSEENREVILNQANKTYITDNIWNRVSFVEGIDGYTTINGRKCLYLPAYSSLEINYKPLESFNTGKTIDISFMVDNISNYNDPIITICDDAFKKDFRGIIIYPDRIIVHTRDLNTNDLSQSYEIQEGALNSIQISYVKGYKVNYGNLITVAVNGGKKREFSFGNDNITTSGNIKLGSNSSDLAIYSLKVYDKGFSSAEFMQNFINSLPSVIEKQAAKALIQSVIDDSYNIDYDRVRGNFNTITVEMLNNAELPHYGLSKDYSAYCNTEFDFCTLPKQYQLKAWKFILKNCKIEGQGTTSMNYWLWNLRWRLDKSDNLIVIYPDGTEATLGEVHFDGVGVHPLVNRITAKKNWASGMQSHKMGATSAFNDLHKHIGLDNEVGGRVAVYQIPVFVFEKILKDGSTTHYNHICRGIYTVGPDKGDKKTFGWNNPAIKDTLITLEGLDHNIKGAGFDYPWEQLVYKQDLEAICVPNSGGFEAGLEVGNCGTAETEEEVSEYLDNEFKDAYKVCYEYSPLIKGTSSSLETINRNVEEWGLQKDSEGHAYQRFEFWIDGEYDVLYLNKVSNKYEKNGINLLEQLNITEEELNGKSIDEKNQIFIQKRIARFKEVASKYWDIEDNMFYIVFCTIFGAKDNGIKNTYPYKMLPFSEGGRYKQRQDDLDSLFPYDNQGLPSAKFWCEWSDFSDENKTAYVFKGEHSNLVQLLLLAFPEVEKDIAHRILDSMQALSKYGSTSFDKLKGFFTTYFFDNAQNYFPISAYNKDIEDGYEEAWPQYTNKNYKVDTDPLAQIVGNAYETEISWIEKRLVYIMSKYQYGPFGYNGYNDDSLGRITYRTQVSQNRTLTPAIPLYPAIANGVNVINSPKRIMDNESITLSGAGGTNTNVYIMAADYLSDIGDLKDLAVDSNQNPILGVSSKRLKTIKVGDENADLVTSNLAGLSIGECPSLIVIDARNLNTLTGEIDLSKCPRLQQALFSATDVRSINLQNGSKLTKLSLPDSITSISLLNHKYLTDAGLEYNALSNVEFYRVEGCNIDSFQLMKDIYTSNDSVLKNIRVLGFIYNGDASDIDLLYDLATKAKGIDSEGNTTNSLPVFEGVLNIEGSVYEDTYLSLLELYSSSEETEKLIINVKGGYYIRFADPEVLRVLMANGVSSDGVGITTADVDAVTSISTWFKENTEITSFDEFEKFTGVTAIAESAFKTCASLESLVIPESVVSIGRYAFKNTSSLAIDIVVPNVVGTFVDTFVYSAITGIEAGIEKTERVSGSAFQGSGIKWAVFPNMVTTGPWAFRSTPLESIFLGQNLTSIDSWAFNDCANIATIVCMATTPPALDSNTIPPSSCIIYVPESAVDAYKAATNWASRADNIKPISEIPTNTTFYERIKDYL